MTADRAEVPGIGLVIANYGGTLLVEGPDGALYRCVARQSAGKAVCGDEVDWTPRSDGTGVVSGIRPRRSLFERHGDGVAPRPTCANVDQLIVVSAVRAGETEPERLLSSGRDLIDRYLATAERLGVTAVLAVNKADLLTDVDPGPIEAAVAPYRLAGYAVIQTSALAGAGIAGLRQALRGRRSVLVGESGVGKSSLIKSLLPDREVRIGAVAAAGGRGRHTTTTTVLFHLPEGGDIIDSPGVREFGLGDVAPGMLAEGFREFHAFRADCRYRDCLHADEPGCAVAAAADRGAIAPARLAAYRRMLRSLTSRAAGGPRNPGRR
jgi:ribosome biogenesis GTPase